MRLHFIPLVCVVLPAVGVHLCYLLAAQLGHVPWCFPYIEGCVSISAAGRQSPESTIFRATVIPTAVLMMVYWKLNHEWLETLKSRMKMTNRAMLWCGITACLGLILYTTTLGAIGQGR